MRLQKAFTILVLLGLLFIPLSGTMSHQTAMAEDTNPPTTDDGSRLDQDVVEDGLVQQPPGSPTGGDIESKSYMTGTDPSQGVEISNSVEITSACKRAATRRHCNCQWSFPGSTRRILFHNSND